MTGEVTGVDGSGNISIPLSIADGAVDNVHISGVAASKLSGNFGAINAGTNSVTAGSVIIGGVTFTVTSGIVTVSNGTTVLMRLNSTTGDAEFRGNVTANASFT